MIYPPLQGSQRFATHLDTTFHHICTYWLRKFADAISALQMLQDLNLEHPWAAVGSASFVTPSSQTSMNSWHDNPILGNPIELNCILHPQHPIVTKCNIGQLLHTHAELISPTYCTLYNSSTNTYSLGDAGGTFFPSGEV
jgi:hypothetical protein